MAQDGIGTVLTRPPLPTKSTITQRPSLLLNVLHHPGRCFFPAQTAADQDRQKCAVAFPFERSYIGQIDECLGLLEGQPVSSASAFSLYTFHSADPGCKFMCHQAVVCGLCCQSSDSTHADVDCGRCQPQRDQVCLMSLEALLDLNYEEDSVAEVDANIVMTGDGRFVEFQATAEQQAFDDAQMDQMRALARTGIAEILKVQTAVLGY